MVGFFSDYYFAAFEFRTDNLWIPVWLLCVTVLIRGAMSMRRAVVAGLLIGFCLAVSLKATVSVLSVLVSLPLAVAVVDREKSSKSWLHLIGCLAVLVATAALVPSITVSCDQNVSGTLDGTAYFGSRFFAAGTHTFESASTYRDLILLWAQAVDRHFMPFEHVISPNG